MTQRKRKTLGFTCDKTDCNSGLHCFRATREMAKRGRVGPCRNCGADVVDWQRVHQCNIADATYTFRALKNEWIRHHFWHTALSQKAINHARRKGKGGLLQCVRAHLKKSIGPNHPFRDGFQTPMYDDTPTVLPHAQHATATCCRKCLDRWHGIPQGQALTPEQIEYCTKLVCLYIDDRLPDLTEDGERIAPVRRTQ